MSCEGGQAASAPKVKISKKVEWEMSTKMKDLISNEHGQGMAEYGLIIALVAVVVIIALTLLGTNINTKFNQIAKEIGK